MTIASVLTVVTFVTRSGHRSVLTHRHAQEFCRWDEPSGMSLFQPTAVGTHWVHTKPRCEVDRDLPYRSSWDNGKEISSFLCWSHQFGPRRLKDRHRLAGWSRKSNRNINAAHPIVNDPKKHSCRIRKIANYSIIRKLTLLLIKLFQICTFREQ